MADMYALTLGVPVTTLTDEQIGSSLVMLEARKRELLAEFQRRQYVRLQNREVPIKKIHSESARGKGKDWYDKLGF